MNSENNLIRKIFSIGIAYLVALAGIELYVYKIEGNPVYSGKITSNIIPYAVFLLVFCLLVCIIMNIPAVKNRLKLSGSNNKVYSVISALIILVVFGILIGCYLNEVNLFDGPAADDYLYHANEKITVIALTAIFIIMLAVIKKENAMVQPVKNKVYLYLFAVVAGLIYAYSFICLMCIQQIIMYIILMRILIQCIQRLMVLQEAVLIQVCMDIMHLY